MISMGVSDMPDNDNKNDAMKAEMLDDVCTIRMTETKRLVEFSETQTQQLYIKFKNLCYSVSTNKGKLLHLHLYFRESVEQFSYVDCLCHYAFVCEFFELFFKEL